MVKIWDPGTDTYDDYGGGGGGGGGGVDTTAIHKTGNETASGIKTFTDAIWSDSLRIDGGDAAGNVLYYNSAALPMGLVAQKEMRLITNLGASAGGGSIIISPAAAQTNNLMEWHQAGAARAWVTPQGHLMTKESLVASRVAAGDIAFWSQTIGAANISHYTTVAGEHWWGNGVAGVDTQLARVGAGLLRTVTSLWSKNLVLDEQTAPTTPASGTGILYFKSDGTFYAMNDSGTEVALVAGGGGGGPPTGTAGGVLGGTYPNPSFAVDMATQAEVDVKANLIKDINEQTANYTLALTDVDGMVRMSNAAARTITFPQNSDVAIPIGSTGFLSSGGAGGVTMVAGTGATVTPIGSAILYNAGDQAQWFKINTNVFYVESASGAARGMDTIHTTVYNHTLIATALQPGPTAFQQPQDVNAQTGTTYTLVAGDVGKLVTLSNAGAVTLTVPQDSDATWVVGAYCDLYALGAGQVTVAAGTGATLRVSGLTAKSRAQYARLGLQKVSANTWSLFGDLAAT